MEKSFTGLDEFMDNISRGGEVEFMYKGRAYFAGLTKVGEYSVYEQGNYSSERCLPHLKRYALIGSALKPLGKS